MAQTRMPSGARSRAIGRVIDATAPLAAAYGTIVIWPSKALIEAVWTMTHRWPSGSGSLVAKAAADSRGDGDDGGTTAGVHQATPPAVSRAARTAAMMPW